jgi:hypothetical protein
MTEKKRTYTVKEIDQYKARLFRQHSREINDTRQEWFDRGKAEGRAQLQREIKDLLQIREDQ